jgi:DNA helicase-2/ATP-dependent DNA helicase PcrA
VIYDDDDAVSLLVSLLDDLSKAEVKQIAHKISRAKDFFLSPDDPGLDMIDHRKSFRSTYRLYEEKMARIGNVDFGDLIKKPVEILRQEPGLAARFRERFRVILVDEYQDANVAQFELLKELCGGGAPGMPYVCVVGDDDQSIYRFRGAEVRNILEFPDRFPGTEIIRLERNYRSTLPILQAASSVVGHNEGRLGKTLRAERGTGKLPVLAFLPDQDEETLFCAKLISNSKAPWSDWAILYRTNAQSLGFETELLRRGIPYRVVGSLKFYEREEIKDALALLSFLVNPRDEVAFRRVVNKPSRGVGPATVDRIIEAAGFSGYAVGDDFPAEAQEGPGNGLIAEDADGNDPALPGPEPQPGGTVGPGGGDLAAAARGMVPGLSAKARSGVEKFLQVIQGGRDLLAGETGDITETKKKKAPKGREGLVSGEGLSVLVVKLIQDSGIGEYHQVHDEISGNQRLNNLQELANAASLYKPTIEGLLEFLEHIELDRSLEDAAAKDREKAAEGAVTLITFHNTKGLEFRRVIMTGLEQGIFPREDKKGEEMGEERRLFYVGATRAMDELYLTSCAARRIYGRTVFSAPSLFLREIDTAVLRTIGKAPYGFGPAPAFRVVRGSSAGASGTAGGKVSSDGRWRIGDRVFHDDHGYGAVTALQEGEDGPVVRVCFENGHELRFLSAFQSGSFTKIGDD